jgi:hypothetical protein
VTALATSEPTARSSALVPSDAFASSEEIASPDERFLEYAEAMLQDGGADKLESQFKASPTDASYDFDEYVFLRNPDDPFARGLVDTGTSQPIPSDPRFQRFVNAAESGLAWFLDQARLSLGNTPQLGVLTTGLRYTLLSWWFAVCAIRAFNRFGRYSRSEIKAFLAGRGLENLSPEEYYGGALGWWLASAPAGVMVEVQGYYTGNGDNTALVKLLTVAFWEDVLTSVFEVYFDGNGISLVDPTAPEGEYPFDPFPADEILFGLQVVHRQSWHLLGYARGELVKSVPLGPKESQKVSVKICGVGRSRRLRRRRPRSRPRRRGPPPRKILQKWSPKRPRS